MTAIEIIQAGSAFLYAALCMLILLRGRISRTGLFLAASCAITAVSLLASAWPGDKFHEQAAVIDLVQSLAWYGFVFHLFRACVPRVRLVRVFGLIGIVAIMLIAAAAVIADPGQSVFSAPVSARLCLAVGRLLLIENLYINTPNRQRWHVALPCISLGGLALFDIALCADMVLQHQVSPELDASRAVAIAVVAPLLAVAAARVRSWQVDIHVSRTAAFHSATLVVSGVFLLTLAALGEATRRIAADWATVIEISLVFAGLLAIGVLLTSYRARLRFRSIVVNHFFSARFDYRHEWSRCVETLSSSDNDTTLHARVIRAAAEAVNSPGGVLFLRATDAAAFEWAGDWNCDGPRAPVLPDEPIVAAFSRSGWVIEAREVWDPGSGSAGAAVTWPASLRALPNAWLAIPLPQRANLIGFIVLTRPPVAFRLDQEVYDLLRMIALEVAAFIAEQRATRIMIQTRELHDYSKRFAFVAHDIKNVSSQLSLLLGNAELHIANPAFQQDMLTTVRASVARIGSLLRRLEAPDADQSAATSWPAQRLETILADYRRRRGRELSLVAEGEGPLVQMNADAFDTVVTHLLNNAIEATDNLSPIVVRIRTDPARVHVHIADRGPGMTSEFIRDELFSPFRTSKRHGSGIGAFQARELLRAAGGDLLVDSTPGQGTTMQLLLNRADIQKPLLQSA